MELIIGIVKNKAELELIVMKYKNNILPVLICVDNGKIQKDVISDLKQIYGKSSIREDLVYISVRNKSEYLCKVRYRDCGKSTIISSQCRNCKEKKNCSYMLEKKQISERKHKYEIIDTNKLVNKLMANLKFYEGYSKVVLYKSGVQGLSVKLSMSEIKVLLNYLRPKKLNTNEKKKINRLCNKCEKQTLIFFDNLGNREKTIKNKNNLIKELEKLEPFESYRVGYILNKLRWFKPDAIVSINDKYENKIVSFKILL